PAPVGSGTLLRIRLAPETPLKGVRAFLVVQALRRLGDVVIVVPPVASLQAEQFANDFALRLVTTSREAEIERVTRGAGDVAAVQIGEDVAQSAGQAIPAVEGRRAAGLPAGTAASDGSVGGGAPRAPRTTQAVPLPNASAPAAAGQGAAPTALDLAAVAGESASVRQSRHVRIDLRRLDSLMNLIGELVITRGRLLQIATGFDDPALADSVTQASRLIGDLRDEIMTSRMVPVWQVFDRF